MIRIEMSKKYTKNFCLSCKWYRGGVCIKPIDSGWCRITRSV